MHVLLCLLRSSLRVFCRQAATKITWKYAYDSDLGGLGAILLSSCFRRTQRTASISKSQESDVPVKPSCRSQYQWRKTYERICSHLPASSRSLMATQKWSQMLHHHTQSRDLGNYTTAQCLEHAYCAGCHCPPNNGLIAQLVRAYG